MTPERNRAFWKSRSKGQHTSIDYNCTMSLTRDPTTSVIFYYSKAMRKSTDDLMPGFDFKYKNYSILLSRKFHTAKSLKG